MMQSLQINPYKMDTDDGERFAAWGAEVLVKASTEQTGGMFNLLEITSPAGFVTPLHIHYAEDVALYVLEGTLTIYWGDQQKQAVAGSYSFQPRGTPHGFRVTGDARFLYLTVPAGFDGFISAGSLSANESELAGSAARHKIEILGPLPD